MKIFASLYYIFVQFIHSVCVPNTCGFKPFASITELVLKLLI